MQVNTIVKYNNPIDQDESILLFKVINYNEVTNRVIMQVLNLPGFSILPTFLESVDNLEIVL
jgi:hypothetical protein